MSAPRAVETNPPAHLASHRTELCASTRTSVPSAGSLKIFHTLREVSVTAENMRNVDMRDIIPKISEPMCRDGGFFPPLLTKSAGEDAYDPCISAKQLYDRVQLPMPGADLVRGYTRQGDGEVSCKTTLIVAGKSSRTWTRMMRTQASKFSPIDCRSAGQVPS